MFIRTSLFEATQADAVFDAADWMTGTLLGEVAVILCVLAVAFVGLLLLTGRLAVMRAMRVVLGCFILLGAPIIASAFISLGQSSTTTPISPPIVQAEASRSDLPPADYDPYAGASLRQD